MTRGLKGKSSRKKPGKKVPKSAKKRPSAKEEKERARPRIWLIAASALFVAFAGLVITFFGFPRLPNGGSAEEARFLVPRSLDALCQSLEVEGFVRSGALYCAYHRFEADGEALRRGEVPLSRNMSPRTIVNRVVRGRAQLPTRFVINEGITRFEIARRLESAGVCSAQDFRAATLGTPPVFFTVGSRSLEGYLFPDTYEFREETEAPEVVARLVSNFDRRVEPLFEASEPELLVLDSRGLTRADVITLASIVEREARLPSERRRIAGVFLNRLESDTFFPRHRLQSDPTTAYGCEAGSSAPSCDGFDGVTTPEMVRDEANLYNTYRHAGLPPGPIGNPGLASIEAVLNAEEHEYLYFVTSEGGAHAFAETYEEHQANIERYHR